MRRVITTSVLSLVILINSLGVASFPTSAESTLFQTEASSQVGSVDTGSVVGSWQLMGEGAPGTPAEDPMLATFLPDGLLTISARAVRPALPGMPFTTIHFSTGHGVWEQGEDGTVEFTVVHLRSDEAGAFRGSVLFSGNLTLNSDDQVISGDATYTVVDPTGAVQGVIPTPLSGQRISIEAPAATPIAERRLAT